MPTDEQIEVDCQPDNPSNKSKDGVFSEVKQKAYKKAMLLKLKESLLDQGIKLDKNWHEKITFDTYPANQTKTEGFWIQQPRFSFVDDPDAKADDSVPKAYKHWIRVYVTKVSGSRREGDDEDEDEDEDEDQSSAEEHRRSRKRQKQSSDEFTDEEDEAIRKAVNKRQGKIENNQMLEGAAMLDSLKHSKIKIKKEGESSKTRRKKTHKRQAADEEAPEPRRKKSSKRKADDASLPAKKRKQSDEEENEPEPQHKRCKDDQPKAAKRRIVVESSDDEEPPPAPKPQPQRKDDQRKQRKDDQPKAAKRRVAMKDDEEPAPKPKKSKTAKRRDPTPPASPQPAQQKRTPCMTAEEAVKIIKDTSDNLELAYSTKAPTLDELPQKYKEIYLETSNKTVLGSSAWKSLTPNQRINFLQHRTQDIYQDMMPCIQSLIDDVSSADMKGRVLDQLNRAIKTCMPHLTDVPRDAVNTTADLLGWSMEYIF